MGIKYKSLIECLETEIPDLVFDEDLMNKIIRFQIFWINRDPEHIAFLGGNTIGVHKVVFTPRDEDILFVDILNVDKNEVQEAIYQTEDIKKERKVSSNRYYLTLMWLLHEFYNSKKFSKKSHDKSAMTLYSLFAYKALTSIINQWFSYQLPEEIAIAANERLSNHFLIKKEGNWSNVIKYRGKALLAPHGLHYERIIKFETEEGMRITADLQGRLKSILKQMMKVIMDVNEEKSKVTKTSMITNDADGGTRLSSLMNRPDVYANNVNRRLASGNGFYDDNVFKLTMSIFTTLREKKFMLVVNNLSDDWAELRPIVDDIMVINIAYILKVEKESPDSMYLSKILMGLKALWSGSRSTYKNVDVTKKRLSKIIEKHTETKRKNVNVPIVLGTILYITLIGLKGD